LIRRFLYPFPLPHHRLEDVGAVADLKGKEGRREGGKEGRREGGKEGRREGGKEGRREGGGNGGGEERVRNESESDMSHWSQTYNHHINW
jgi:hypothetical protein